MRKMTNKKTPLKLKGVFLLVAGVQGFEPRSADSKSDVLPLDDTPIARYIPIIALSLRVVNTIYQQF